MTGAQRFVQTVRSADAAAGTQDADRLEIAREVAREEARLSPHALRDRLLKETVALQRVLDPRSVDVDYAHQWTAAVPDERVAPTLVQQRLLLREAQRLTPMQRLSWRDRFRKWFT